MVNYPMVNYFNVERSVRQGCHIAAVLYELTAERLHALLKSLTVMSNLFYISMLMIQIVPYVMLIALDL